MSDESHTNRRSTRWWLALGGLVLMGCGRGHGDPALARPATPEALLAVWRPPADSLIRSDSIGYSIRRGLALMLDTRDSLPEYARSSLNCTSCHLDGGRRTNAAALYGVYARFPQYLTRAAAVIPIADRVNYCITRSLSGNRLPTDSREMQDILAYLAFISRGVPVGYKVPGTGMPKMPGLVADSGRGHLIFTQICSKCHGPQGQGIGRAPALWGPRSFSIAASMARVERAASFIRHNMPFNAPGTLTDQQAWDVAAYVDSHARPDLPGKENDWPLGDAPADVPYRTAGHEPAVRRTILPRANPAAAEVPPPPSARARAAPR